jgi:methionine synthase I (cobalamin-dependent)/5,10-methylenetetrahydrofolate reductase
MHRSFWERIEEEVLVGDGGMGTMIYSKGVAKGQCFDELNILRPELIKEIHTAYIGAGAQIIETNTFGANRAILDFYGLGGKTKEINYQGAKIAKEVARKALVAGCVGPVSRPYESLKKPQEIEELFYEQIQALAEGGAELVFLDTFSDIEEAKCALLASRRVGDLPVVCNFSFLEDEKTLTGLTPEEVAREMYKSGARIAGSNCGIGAQGVLEAIERMGGHFEGKLSAFPNAGLPKFVGGRFLYPSPPEYFATYALRYLKAGASIVGGCCGSTPAHIRAISEAIRGLKPKRKPRADTGISLRTREEPTEAKPLSSLREMMGRKFLLLVEMDPPRGVDISNELEVAQRLKTQGVDGVTISDSPMARVRMSPLPLSHRISSEIGLEVILHFTCRDRNILGLQSDLLGAYALGIENILALTGDPPSVGDYPYAVAVFEVTSTGLLRIIRSLNQGMDLAGNPLSQRTTFFVGIAANPGAANLEGEAERLEEKASAGADFILTQPLFDPAVLKGFLKRVAHLQLPVIVGLLPLYSLRHAEFLQNEVPGINIPEAIMERIKRGEDGIEIASGLLKETRGEAAGVCIMPPFHKYDMAERILKGLEGESK